MATATQSMASALVSWTFAFGCMAASVVYFDELKALGRMALGLPSPEAMAARAEAGDAGGANSAAEVRRSGERTVQLKAGGNGHFHTPADVNGRSIDVMVDTGASIVALTFEDAERAGVFVREADFTHRVSTANGTARVAPVMLDRVTIGEITVRDVRAAVAERGKLDMTLLGMSFLGRLSRTEMSRGTLILQE